MTYNKRAIIIQFLVLVAIIAILYFFYYHAIDHLNEEGIIPGFDFLTQSCGFDLIMHLIPFSSTSTYLQAFYVVILNTLFLSILAILFATLLGITIAFMRLSRNWLLIKLGAVYIEFFRNIPLLLQVFFWYYIFLKYMPQTDNSYMIFNTIRINVLGMYVGKFVLIPELMALLISLSLYAANYISDFIYRGIKEIPKGQIEAAIACGMYPSQIFKLIVLPQALRHIVPRIISQYVSIVKNSSLGSAIGYPELVAVFAGTVPNHTGHAIEAIFMAMLVYLSISLIASYFMNWFHKHMAIIER